MLLWFLLCLTCLFWTPSRSQGGRNYRPTLTRELPKKEVPGQGVLVGKEIATYRTKCLAYLGVPFAEPPIGELRFAPPVTPPKPWSGVRNASKFAPACMQSIEQFQEQDRLFLRLHPALEFSEDCLYLNLFLPDGGRLPFRDEHDWFIAYDEIPFYFNFFFYLVAIVSTSLFWILVIVVIMAGNPPVDGWPIMLWYHPGNYSVGATSLWDGSAMAIGQKVIVVTAAYRLNIFGFLSTFDEHVPGNGGLLDQVAALDWVRDKIAAFGGNPQNIVLCGHSGGGASAGLHLLSPLSEGKFSKAIIMSAWGLVSRSVKSSEQMSQAMRIVADNFVCELESKLLIECLRMQPAQHLLQHTSHLFSEFGPIVDKTYVKNQKPFLQDEPVLLVGNHQIAQIPVLMGYTDMEEALNFLEGNNNAYRGVSWDDYKSAVSELVGRDIQELNVNDTCIEELGKSLLYDTTIFYYTPRPLTYDTIILRERLIALLTEKYYGAGAHLLAAALDQINIPSYVYRFDYKMKTENFIRFPANESHSPPWVNAPHQFDLPFAWGMPYWTNLLKNITWNSADKKMTDTILTLWGNFVKFGNPTQTGVNLRWDVFHENSSGIMLLDRNSNMSDTLLVDYKAFEFWNNYYPEVYSVIKQSCNMSSFADSTFSHISFKTPLTFSVMVLLHVNLFVR